MTGLAANLLLDFHGANQPAGASGLLTVDLHPGGGFLARFTKR